MLCLQLDEELVQDKISAVQRYRSMFIYATQPQHPPSASDIIVELMCTNAKYGLRGLMHCCSTKRCRMS